MNTAAPVQRGSAITASILDGSWVGLPFLFLDFRDLRSVSAREWLLHSGGDQYRSRAPAVYSWRKQWIAVEDFGEHVIVFCEHLPGLEEVIWIV